jgi:hypothetical protein
MILKDRKIEKFEPEAAGGQKPEPNLPKHFLMADG